MIPKNENDLIVVDLEMTRFVPDVCQSTPQTGGTDHRADGYYR